MTTSRFLKNIKNIFIVIWCVGGGLCVGPIDAKPLYIEITGGKNIGTPIAIAPFSQDLKISSNRNEDLADIIRNDLHNTGQFRVLPVDEMRQRPKDLAQVNFNYWKKMGVEHLVVGQVVEKPNNKLDINFQLVDIYRNNKTPVLNLRFANKKASQFRDLAHHISNNVFEKIVGIKGFFSTRIAYITVDKKGDETIHTLTVADADGYNDRPLISAPYPIMSPAWSADGKKIAFVSFHGNHSSIKIVELASGKIQNISNSPGINGAPSWSPDDKYLALVLSKEGAPKIYIMDLETKHTRRITSGGSIDTEPTWSPDGKSIVFTSNRGGKPQIYRVALDTGKVQRLTFKGDYNATPTVTPDGENLVILHQTDDGAFNIAAQSLKTGQLKVLTQARLNESPSLAPNGMMVLYGIVEDYSTVLGAVSLDGRFKMRLPVQDGNVKEPAWSPFLS